MTGLKQFHSAPTIAKVAMLQVDDWLPVASHGCSNPTSCSCPKTNFPMTMWTTHGSTAWRYFEIQLGLFQS